MVFNFCLSIFHNMIIIQMKTFCQVFFIKIL
nr:MAG TPA: hypothetical protein [Caudoviricetes sp.]